MNRDESGMKEAGSDLRQAAELLLMLARTEFTIDEREPVTARVFSFNAWKLFARMAVRHGVAALVWQNLLDLSLAERLPLTERNLLEGLRLQSIARVSWISESAAGVISLLEKRGIRVVLLKGLALEHTLYGSRGLRQMSDADLLVAPEDAMKAREILIREGFRSKPVKSPLYSYIMMDLGNHLPELHRGGVSVDLHHRLFGIYGEEMVVRAIRDSEVIETAGYHFRVLPPQTAFLALVRHIYKHEVKGEFQLRLWTDIFLLLQSYGRVILTEGLHNSAIMAGVEQEVRIVLTVMKQVWGVEIPETMRLLPEEEEREGVRFMNNLISPETVVAISRQQMFRMTLSQMQTPLKKLIFIAGDLFPSVSFMKQRYGCKTSMGALLRYPHRLGKLAWILGLKRESKE